MLLIIIGSMIGSERINNHGNKKRINTNVYVYVYI